MCVAPNATVGGKSHKCVKVLRFKARTNKKNSLKKRKKNQIKSWHERGRKRVRALYTKGLNKFTLNFYEKMAHIPYMVV